MNKQELIAEHGSIRNAAKNLGIPRSTLRSRLKAGTFLSAAASAHGFDAGKVSNYWMKTKDGSFHVREEKAQVQSTAEIIRAAFKGFKTKAKPVKSPKFSNSELMTVYPVADLHVGMLAWGYESGEDWDLKIAKKTIIESIRDLVSRSPDSETAMIVNLGDWYHINDSKNETPASGHLLDVDSRYEKMIFTGVTIMLSLIDLVLQKHDK